MQNQPYLETCCRAALHRLALSGAHGRPADLADGPCLERLCAMNFARRDARRFFICASGNKRHATEIMLR